jgi:hypothetical protein
MVEAAGAAAEGGESDNFPKAVNQTIYMMLAIPFSALMFFGFMTWRGMVKNDVYRQALRDAQDKKQKPEPEA